MNVQVFIFLNIQECCMNYMQLRERFRLPMMFQPFGNGLKLLQRKVESSSGQYIPSCIESGNIQQEWLENSIKRLRHGQQQAEYLEHNWNLRLQPGDVQAAKGVALEENVSTILEKNKALEKEKAQLEKENSRMKQSKEKLSRTVQKLSKLVQKARADGISHPVVTVV